jgi:hypothetical protein
MTLDPSERYRLLSWLAEELRTHELAATVVRQNGRDASAVLRSLNARGETRFVACVPAPQMECWAWVWSYGCALTADARAVAWIAAALRK